MVNREFKLVVLGAGAVGKSCMTVQLVSHQFIDFYDPTIEDSYRKQTVIDGETVQLDILDTAGQDEYSAMRDQYMRTGQGFVLVFDVTNRATFDVLAAFADQVSRVKDAAVCDVPMIVVGNKCDLEQQRTVSFLEARAFAESIGACYGECSAFRRFNIDEVFADAVRQVKRHDCEPKQTQQQQQQCRDVLSIAHPLRKQHDAADALALKRKVSLKHRLRQLFHLKKRSTTA
jgi:GTPase KRas protein